MQSYICEICGKAHIGREKPTDCPFCGARNNFIQPAQKAVPIIAEKIDLSDVSRKNLKETLALEIGANAIYLCMAEKATEYEIKSMYERLAAVELEHARIAAKMLDVALPESQTEKCSDESQENFRKTIELEDRAAGLYRGFAVEAKETSVRKFFGALMQVEIGHIELIKNLEQIDAS